MKLNIKEAINSENGGIIVSIILGLGLATLFRKVCEGNKCILIKGPEQHEVDDHVYKINNDCFKYEPVSAECA
jgi:hypothetical protein